MQAIALGEHGSLDPVRVGHKAANLARFAASYHVPPGFVLATDIYDALQTALAPGGDAERERLRAIVREGYEHLARTVGDSDPAVAVRSSATGEDSADASFAGQHETILDVRGVDDVTDAVLACWRSAGNERVTAYRREKGIDRPVQVAVLVQRMVPSEVSAIAFGVDPVSGDREVVVIDAAPGLGDRIAAGEITPDRYTVRKADLEVSDASGPALSTAQAQEVARLVLSLERENGHDVDVECAFAGGDLYLLQCRPITTLANAFVAEWRDPADAKLFWRRDDAHFGEPAPRLVTDYTEYGPSRGLQRRAELFDLPLKPRLEGICGRIYTTAVRRVPTGDLAELGRSGTARVRADARHGRRRWEDEQLPALHAHYAWYEARTAEVAGLERAALAPLWDEAWTRLGEIWVIHMLAVWAAFAMGDELAETYEKLTGGSTLDALKLTQGRAHTLQQLERDLHALAALSASGDTEAFATAMREFLASPHGNLGNSGEDLRRPVWRDEPSLLLAELGRRLSHPQEHPDVRHARLIAEGNEVERRAREILRDRPEDLARFEEVLTTARAVAPLTEEHNYHLDRQIQSILRRFIQAIGARMVADGQLATQDEIFFFHVTEIAAALRDGERLQERARERANEFAGWRRLRHPRTLGLPGPVHAMSTRTDLNFIAKQDREGLIKGVPASGGTRRARVCIVRGAQDFAKLKPGEVLVCRSSNVSWVPLFTIAAAVVTDVGGALSHAAVVAREFGVPAVVGCGVALETLHDGEMVEVDGDEGTVRSLDAHRRTVLPVDLPGFPFTWPQPGDERLSWQRNDEHFGMALPPISQEWATLGAARGARRLMDEQGFPFAGRNAYFNGRRYHATWPRDPAMDRDTATRLTNEKRRALARPLAEKWQTEYLPRVRAHYSALAHMVARIDSAAAPLNEVANDWEDLWERVGDVWYVHALTAFGAYGVMEELAGAYRELVGGTETDAFKLTHGRTPTLHQLDRDLRALGQVRATGDAAAFASALRAFVATTHGNVGQAGDDLRQLAWADDPDALVRELDRRLAAGVDDPDARVARLLEEGARIEAHARATLAERPDDLARFEQLLALARISGPLTEEHNYWIDRQIHAYANRTVRGVGRRLAAERLIDDADDIFFLYVDEVRETLRAAIDRRTLVVERRAEFERWKLLDAPPWLGAPPASSPAVLEAAEAGVITGIPASSGVRRGRARLVHGTHEFHKMTKGDVLVCRMSHVSWIPLFTIAAALVTDVGGSLSHAAVIAREFGLPAVVGCKVALSTLRDGDLIEVDGDRGTVRTIDGRA